MSTRYECRVYAGDELVTDVGLCWITELPARPFGYPEWTGTLETPAEAPLKSAARHVIELSDGRRGRFALLGIEASNQPGGRAQRYVVQGAGPLLNAATDDEAQDDE